MAAQADFAHRYPFPSHLQFSEEYAHVASDTRCYHYAQAKYGLLLWGQFHNRQNFYSDPAFHDFLVRQAVQAAVAYFATEGEAA